MGLQKLMSEAWAILRKNPIIFTPALVVALLSVGLEMLPTPTFLSLNEVIVWFLTLVVIALVNLFLMSTIIRMVYDAKRRMLSLGGAVRFVASRYLTILAATILFSVIIGLGLVALIIPGIYLGVRLFFFDYSILVDGEDTLGSLKKSWKIVKGKWWDIFGLLIVVVLPIIAVIFPISFAFIIFSIPLEFLLIFYFFVYLFYIPWVCSVFTLAYLEIKER